MAEMNLTEYQAFTKTTSLYKDTDSLFLGLCEEAGEVAGKRKKWNRGDYPLTPIKEDPLAQIATRQLDFMQALTKELGDVLWYVSEICNTHGLTIQEVIEANVAKLKDRKERGVIQGSGDLR